MHYLNYDQRTHKKIDENLRTLHLIPENEFFLLL